MPTLTETIAFISQAHAGQVDKDSTDYYLHPIAVMQRLPADVDEEVKLAALPPELRQRFIEKYAKPKEALRLALGRAGS